MGSILYKKPNLFLHWKLRLCFINAPCEKLKLLRGTLLLSKLAILMHTGAWLVSRFSDFPVLFIFSFTTPTIPNFLYQSNILV